jgi:hypothetical protein
MTTKSSHRILLIFSLMYYKKSIFVPIGFIFKNIKRLIISIIGIF